MQCNSCIGCLCLFVQAQHDYLAGNYPVVREDAAQMCALQMQAEAGPTMLDSPESLETAIERFIHKQVLSQDSYVLECPVLPNVNGVCSSRHLAISC